jgi:hypothetical protein
MKAPLPEFPAFFGSGCSLYRVSRAVASCGIAVASFGGGLTTRCNGRVRDEVPSSYAGVRAV